jgi:hypothetical protein
VRVVNTMDKLEDKALMSDGKVIPVEIDRGMLRLCSHVMVIIVAIWNNDSSSQAAGVPFLGSIR